MNTKDSKASLIKEALKKEILPLLRSQEFKGSFPNFKRKINDEYQFITFQFGTSSLVGKFIVELGVVKEDELPLWVKTSNSKIDDGLSRKRYRLGQVTEGEDGAWFDFSNTTSAEDYIKLAFLVKTRLEEALNFFQPQTF